MKRFFLLFILFTPALSSAEDACPKARVPRDILDCALRLHPEIRAAQAAVLAAQEGVSTSGQRPNPEMTSQIVRGGPADSRFTYGELNFTHIFELGGKRSARIARGRANFEQSQANLLAVREEAFTSTWLVLHRLRQIRDRLALLDEALGVYGRVVKQYADRPALSPELTVSRRIFELAQSDLALKRATLEIQADAAAREVERAIGRALTEGEPLPEKRRDWPETPDNAHDQPAEGGALARAQAGVEEARSFQDTARSLAWPEFRAGPTIERQTGAGGFSAYGVNFGLGLPFYQRNGAGRLQADRDAERARLTLAAVDHEQRDLREGALYAYRRSVAALAALPDAAAVNAGHDETERLFARGVVAAPLLLEAHRQRLDLAASQDERELATVENYARLQALRGRLTEGAP